MRLLIARNISATAPRRGLKGQYSIAQANGPRQRRFAIARSRPRRCGMQPATAPSSGGHGSRTSAISSENSRPRRTSGADCGALAENDANSRHAACPSAPTTISARVGRRVDRNLCRISLDGHVGQFLIRHRHADTNAFASEPCAMTIRLASSATNAANNSSRNCKCVRSRHKKAIC